jgi:hypothetical protein
MNATGKSILTVAKAYAAMLNPTAKETVSEGFKRPKWMPESIMDEMASDFVAAVKEAQEGGKDTFEFGGKKYKVSLGKAEEPKGEAPLPKDEEKKAVKESLQLTGEQQIASLVAAYKSMYEAAEDAADDKEDKDEGEEEKGEEEKDEANEELKGDQHKLDVDGDGKIEGEDLAKLRAGVKKEALDPKADAGVWIKDFQQSDDPKFDGKDADKRKEMALAAWYAARRDAGIKEEDAAEIKHDNVTDKEADQDEMEPAPAEVKESMASWRFSDSANKASAAAKDKHDVDLHKSAYDAHIAAGNAHAEKAAHTSDTEDSAKHMNIAADHLKRATVHSFLAHRYAAKKSGAVKESVLNEDDLTKKAKEGSDPASSEKFEPSAEGEKKFKDAHKAEVSDYSDNTKENPTGADKVKKAADNKTGGKPSTETVGPDIEAKTGEEKVSQNPENKTSGVGDSPTVDAEKKHETGAEKISQAPENKTKG